MEISSSVFLDALLLLVNDNSTNNQNAVKELIEIYNKENKGVESSDSDLIEFYIKVIKTIMADQIDREKPDELKVLLIKFKTDKVFEDRREIVDLIQEVLDSRNTATVDTLEGYIRNIQNVLIWNAANEAMRKGFGRLRQCAAIADPQAQAESLGEIKNIFDEMGGNLQKAYSNTGSVAVDRVVFGDKASIAAAMNKFTQRNVGGRIKTGLVGLNRALGKANGFVAGESCSFNALPHNYKSGILMSCAVWSVIYNVLLAPEGDKPLVFISSLENEAFQNMIWIFKQRYKQTTGNSPDGMTDDEIIEWVYKFFQEKNCELVIERHMPHLYTADAHLARLDYYKEQGYNINVAIIDYANLMAKGSNDNKASRAGRDLGVRELFSTLCNEHKTRGITFITAHPLNRDAMKSISGQINQVKKMSAEFLADSVDVEREVDVSIFMHIETTHDGRSFLTFKLTKHRYVDDTPNSHKYFAYEFPADGSGIPDDIDSKPQFVTDIYAAAFNDNEPQGQPMVASSIF